MTTKTEDRTRARNDTLSVRTGIVPDFSAVFWTYWLLAAMSGEIAGHALNHIYLHRSGRTIVALMLCFLAVSILQGAPLRLPRTMFWSAAFLLSLLGAVLAEATDLSMGIGDIGAIALIAILLIFSFVICYRLTGTFPGPTDGSNVRGFFWTTAMLAQTVASACADWIIDPGAASQPLSIAVIALGISATIGLYSCTRVPRSVLFWYAFVLSGIVAAIGGHIVLKSIECSTQNAGASCGFNLSSHLVDIVVGTSGPTDYCPDETSIEYQSYRESSFGNPLRIIGLSARREEQTCELPVTHPTSFTKSSIIA